MGLTVVTVVVLIFGVVLDDTAGIIAGTVVLVFVTLTWVVLPMSLLPRAGGSPCTAAQVSLTLSSPQKTRSRQPLRSR